MTRCSILTLAAVFFSPAATAHVPRHLAGTQCQVFFYVDATWDQYKLAAIYFLEDRLPLVLLIVL